MAFLVLVGPSLQHLPAAAAARRQAIASLTGRRRGDALAGSALASCGQGFTIPSLGIQRHRPPAPSTPRAATRRRGATFLCGEDESWP
jgi:hypothetical protein